MSPTRPNNVAARMGRWSADHWKTATFGWLAFVVVAVFLGGAIGTNFIDPNAPGPGESGRMDKILDEGFKQLAGESVFIQHPSLRTTDPAFAAATKDVVTGISSLEAVQNVAPARSPRAGTPLSSTSRSAATPTTPRTRSPRSSPRSTRRRGPIRSSSSGNSATPARSRRSKRHSQTTSPRPVCCRSRSRSQSSSSPSARSWPPASHCCSR